MIRDRAPVLIAVALAAFAAPDSSEAQNGPRREEDLAGWTNDATLILVNGLLGGLTSGVRAAIEGRSLKDAFSGGFWGGAVSYAGKRAVATPLPVRRWLGRQVAAFGLSVSDNAARGEPLTSRLFFPVGPLALEWDRRPGARTWAISVDVSDLVWIFRLSTDFEFSIDWGESFASGTTVFQGRSAEALDRWGATGLSPGSVVMLEPLEDSGPVIDHEIAHVIQHDAEARLVFDHLESFVISRTFPELQTGFLRVRPGVLRHGFRAGLGLLDWFDGYREPWEQEATWIELRARRRSGPTFVDVNARGRVRSVGSWER